MIANRIGFWRVSEKNLGFIIGKARKSPVDTRTRNEFPVDGIVRKKTIAGEVTEILFTIIYSILYFYILTIFQLKQISPQLLKDLTKFAAIVLESRRTYLY